MSLLDTLVALVILGLAGVGFLEVFQATSRSSRNAEEWVRAVADAEAVMEATKLGTAAADLSALAAGAESAAGRRTVEVRPWLGVSGVDLVTVTVALPDGGAFVLRRLVRTP